MDEFPDQGANRRQRVTSKSARISGGMTNYHAERFSHTHKMSRQMMHSSSHSPFMNASMSGAHSSQHNLMITGSVLPTSVIGDKVVITEHPQESGVLMIYRSTDERLSNPDRLNLDRRGLRSCPVLEGEDQLRLLNYQHNQIQKIDNLTNLRRLLFLDLYDNEIHQITGLTSLRALRVLMLGKNRIRKIEGLDTLQSLDVLDLHANLITEIDGLSRLSELRVLNLASNQITHVTNLQGLQSLTELNLRRNKIRLVEQIDKLPSLQRLFLSFNEIANFDEIANLCESKSLLELTIDANPVNLIPNYRFVLIRKLSALQQLDMKPVTDEERRMILYMFRREDESLQRKREPGKLEALQEKRNLVLSQTRQLWEAQQVGTDTTRSTRSAPMRGARYTNSKPSSTSSKAAQHSPSDEEDVDDEQERLQTASKHSSRVNSGVAARHITTVPNIPLPIATVSVTASYDRKIERPPSGAGQGQGQQRQVARVNAMPRNNRSPPPNTTPSESQSASNAHAASRSTPTEGEDSRNEFAQPSRKASESRNAQDSTSTEEQSQQYSAANPGAGRSHILSESPLRVDGVEQELTLSSFTTADEQQTHLIELDGDSLCLCGPAALNALERISTVPLSASGSGSGSGSGAAQGASGASTHLNPSAINRVYFLFIRFEQIVQSLHRVRSRLPVIRAFKFRGNGISTLSQLNALANLHRIESLEIDNSDDGNPLIGTCRFWREYAIFRLGHLGLRELNGQPVEVGEVRAAEGMFSGLQTLTTKYQRLASDKSDQKDEKSAGSGSGESNAQDGANLMANALANLAYCATTRESDQTASAHAHAHRQMLSGAFADAISTQERKSKVARCWDHLFKLYVSRQLAAIETVGLARFEKEQYEDFIRRELANK